MLVHHRVNPPALHLKILWYLLDTPMWREALQELSVLPNNTTQGLETGSLDQETSAGTNPGLKAVCLQGQGKICTWKILDWQWQERFGWSLVVVP